MTTDHLETLRSAVLAIPRTGHNGFEGLVAASLSKITGLPFRLSSSGSQYGVDGRSVYADPRICFECKLYCNPIDRGTVTSKLGELANDDRGTDLWALCATSQVSAQIAEHVRGFGDQHGISTLVLDWSEEGLPPLAVVLAMASYTVADFLSRQVKDQSALIGMPDALDAVRNSPGFVAQADRMRATLTDPTIGIETARMASAKWLNEALADKQIARSRLGQPSLSPGDRSEVTPQRREYLLGSISNYLSGPVSEKILCIVGEEGTGKSWSVAQSWLSNEAKPLMLFISPNLFKRTADENDVQDLLVTTIIRQTGGGEVRGIRNKWLKILAQSKLKKTGQTRLIVLVDGVNQRPEKDWGRILDKLAAEIYHLEGRLVVTSRTSFFRNHIGRRLAYPREEIEVVEWTEEERDTILAQHEMVGADLAPKVGSALRNPRILGIALCLLTRNRISKLEELSVSRLLFEHILTGESDAPTQQPIHETIRFIRQHAAAMLERIGRAPASDLTVDEAELHAAAEGRFFAPIEDEPGRYELTDDGLPLALAFLMTHRMRQFRRQGRDLIDGLGDIVEPIAALDLTSEVLVAAITVICLQDPHDETVAVALIAWIAELQNLMGNYVHELANMAMIRPLSFAKATHRLCLRGGTQPNHDLIAGVLITASRDDRAWSAIREYIESWLTHYTIGPRYSPVSFSENQQDRQEKRNVELRRLKQRIGTLSRSERSLIDGLSEVDGDVQTLSTLAIALLASKPRAPAAKAIVACAYALGLSTDYYGYSRNLMHLVRLNRIDWADARIDLLREASFLRAREVSKEGRWALVWLLRATGDRGDASEADGLSERLSEGEHQVTGQWRLVEKYCATDPCDPASVRPSNVNRTAAGYSRLEFGVLDKAGKLSQSSLFFDMARPCMARFERKRAADVHERYIRTVISDVGSDWNPRINDLRSYSVLFGKSHVRGLLGAVLPTPAGQHGLRGDRWRASQYRLLLAFPHLDGIGQSDALTTANSEPLLELMGYSKSIPETLFEERLEVACRANEESAQFSLLFIACSTGTGVSRNARKRVAQLLRSESARVRAQAIGVVAGVHDEALLSEVIRSGWSATDTDRLDEKCYGSRILVRGASLGLIDYKGALSRMSVGYWGMSAREWEGDGVRAIAAMVDEGIQEACGLEDHFGHVVDVEVLGEHDLRPRASLSAESVFSPDEGEIERLSVGKDEFDRRLKDVYDKLVVFEKRLREKRCEIILHHVELDEFRKIADADNMLSDSWYDLLVAAPHRQLHVVHNLGSLVGYAVGYRCATKAVRLFQRVNRCEPMVRVRYGHARITLESRAVWGGADAEALNRLRMVRLDEASNDGELAQETLAAHLGGKMKLVYSYVESRLASSNPADKARALMVCGFSDTCDFVDSVFDEYRQHPGFLGEVCKAALDGYDRNEWARHWYGEMCRTVDSVEFWAFSVLFLKIVDGRYDYWCGEYKCAESMKPFLRNLRDALDRRVRKWQKERERKLFGSDVPDSLFLESSSGV